jgi:hypothetical protein
MGGDDSHRGSLWRHQLLEMVRIKGKRHGSRKKGVYHTLASQEKSEHGASTVTVRDSTALETRSEIKKGAVIIDRTHAQTHAHTDNPCRRKKALRRGQKGSRRHRKNVLRQRTVVMVTGNYGLLAMAYILLEETIPLFLKLDADKGGFSFSSAEIGFLLSVSGGVMLIFTTFVLPVVAVHSKRWMFNTGIYGAVPVTFSWPLLAMLNSNVLDR